jgi:fatty acid desaturase
VNADEFRRQYPKLAREVMAALLLAQYRIDRETRPRPVWTYEMVRTAVVAAFAVGFWFAMAVWMVHTHVSGWWLLLPGVLIPAYIGGARDSIRKARARLATAAKGAK